MAPREDGIDVGEGAERPSSTPTGVDAHGWKASVKEVGSRYQEHRVPLAAGGLAYYWFLALFPALIALVGAVSLIGLSDRVTQTLTQGAETTLPPGASDVVTEAVSSASAGGGGGLVAVIIGVAIALFGATKGMVAVQQALDIAYDVDPDDKRGFLAQRGVAIVMLLATAVLGLSAAALIVFGVPIGKELREVIPVAEEVFTVAWTVARWVAAILLISLLFSVLYYVGPSVRQTAWRWVTPGGLVAALIWAAASAGFSVYISEFGSYGETYGAIAGVVVLILWLYLTGLATLVGGELNAALDARRGHGQW